jgi:hypothetical protein
MASKERQIQRWNKILQPINKELTCYICGFTQNIDLYKK